MNAKKNTRSRITEISRQPDEVRAAIDFGIDIQALIDNLKRTPTERIRRHQIALDTVQMLRKAKHR